MSLYRGPGVDISALEARLKRNLAESKTYKYVEDNKMYVYNNHGRGSYRNKVVRKFVEALFMLEIL